MRSIWQDQSFWYQVDVAIVGCGLTGLLTAIYIKQQSPGTSVRILEKHPHPAGASVKNAGFACFGSLSEILDDIHSEGEDGALQRVLKRHEGLQMLRQVTRGCNIGYAANGGYEVFTESERGIYHQSLEALEDINSKLAGEIGLSPFAVTSNSFGFRCLDKLIYIQGEACVDSGKLVQALIYLARKAGVEFSFGCEISQMEKEADHWWLNTSTEAFKASSAVIATNGFTHNLLVNKNIVAYRGQVLLTEPIANLALKGNFHLNQGYFYFRPYAGGIMLGGGRHLDRENEQTDQQDVTGVIQDALENLLRNTIVPGKEVKIRKRWAGTLAYGPQNEKEPVVEKLQPGLFVGARLGGMGIAMAPQVARKLTHMIL